MVSKEQSNSQAIDAINSDLLLSSSSFASDFESSFSAAMMNDSFPSTSSSAPTPQTILPVNNSPTSPQITFESLFSVTDSTQQDQKGEIIDLNLFDMLQSELDPEMTSLLESMSTSDIGISYLPQISVNTATKILERQESNPAAVFKPTSATCTSPGTQTLVKLDEIIPTDGFANCASNSFKDFCDMLALDQSDVSTATQVSTRGVGKVEACDETAKPSRVSLRIKSKKNATNKPSNMFGDDFEVETQTRARNSGGGVKRRANGTSTSSSKRHEASAHNSSSRNSSSGSIDLDRAYFGLGEDSSLGDEEEPTTGMEEGDYSQQMSIVNNGADEESSNDRDFKEYVKRYRSLADQCHEHNVNDEMTNSNACSESGDPTRKESNKEAATRYRLKKLNEKDTLFETRRVLEKDNDQVKKKIELVQTEINYLKMVLVQMLLAKGVLHSDLVKS